MRRNSLPTVDFALALRSRSWRAFHNDTENRAFPYALKTGFVSERLPIELDCQAKMTKISFVRRRAPPVENPDGRAAPVAKARRVILILGMHRSGTSMLAHILNLLGAGIARSVLQPDQWNEGGYWESRSLNIALDEFLHALGSSWFDLSAVPADAHRRERMRPYFEAIRSVVDEETRGYRLSVIKDPRNCRLVPLWRDIIADIGAEPLAIIHFREPLAVADSLARRNGFSTARSCLLWLRHVVDAERDTRSWPRVFMDDALLLSDWRRALQPLVELGWYDAKRLSGPLGHVVDAAIKPRLRHSGRGGFDAGMLPEPRQWYLNVYDACVTLAKENRSGSTDVRFDQIRSALDSMVESGGVEQE